MLRLERKAGASIRRSSVQKKRMMVISQGPPSRSRSFFVMPERSARFDSARLFLVAYRGGFTGNCFTGMPPNSYRGPGRGQAWLSRSDGPNARIKVDYHIAFLLASLARITRLP